MGRYGVDCNYEYIYKFPEMIQYLVISALLIRHSSDSRLENTKNTLTVDMRVTGNPVYLHLISWDMSTNILSKN